jgi:branched-chain amino acid transport system substrate-binding protein
LSDPDPLKENGIMLALRKSRALAQGAKVGVIAAATCLVVSGCALRVSHDQVVAASGARAASLQSLGDAPSDTGGSTTPLPTATVGPITGPVPSGPARSVPGSPSGPVGGTTGNSVGAPPPAPHSALCKGTGTIVIGNVSPYGASAVGQNYAPGRDALKIWEADVNQRGGICGRPVQVITMDDGGNASKTSADLRDLVENKHAVAIVGWGTAFTLSAGQGYLEQKQIPVIGGDLLSMAWSSSPVMFPEGTGFDEAIYGALTASKRPGAANKLALFYCAEAQSCSDANQMISQEGIANAAGTPLVYSAKVSLTAVSFASECQQAHQAGADILLMGGDASFVERIANSCAQQGLTFRYTTISVAVQDAQAQNPNFQNGNFAVATPVIPWPSTATVGAEEYSAAYHRYYPNLVNSGMAIAYWASAKLAEKIIASIGSGPVTPATVLAAARQVRNETLDNLTGPLTFRSSGGQGSPRCFGVVEIFNQKWVARDNGKMTCRSGPPLTKQGGGTA